ncbi:hypothetical protein AB1N83_005142 [Pleurotus pulmonarius]
MTRTPQQPHSPQTPQTSQSASESELHQLTPYAVRTLEVEKSMKSIRSIKSMDGRFHPWIDTWDAAIQRFIASHQGRLEGRKVRPQCCLTLDATC